MVYVGQMETYGKGVEMLEKIGQVRVCEAQLYRVTDYYGALLDSLPEEEEEEVQVSTVEEGEVVYAQMDGSMILTDEGWQEVKLGRVFKESACQAKGVIEHSTYAAHLGNLKAFYRRYSPLIQPYAALGPQLVFLTDGAVWIKKWIQQNYPESTQILDFYHAKEHLAHFAEQAELPPTWLDEQSERLKQGQIREVIKTIRRIRPHHTAAQQTQQRLLLYLMDNEYRMQYKDYLDWGLSIGSGAIEAANRTVVQARLKRSGQRWSKKGAQHMLNLRVVFMSNQWKKVTDLIQTMAAAA